MSRFAWRRHLRSPRSAQRKPTGFAFTVSDLEVRTMLSVVAGLVSDINQLATNPTNLTESAASCSSSPRTASQGTESLWATDGTSQGSVELARSTNPATACPSNSPPFVSQDGMVYFMSTDSSGDQGLFKIRRNGRRHRAGRPAYLPRKQLGGRRRKDLFHRDRPLRSRALGL